MGKTRIFLDVNVAMDLIITTRQPFHDEARYLVKCSDIRSLKLMLSSGGVSNIIYNVNKYKIDNPNTAIWELVERCDILNAHKSTLFTAFHSEFRDKEDASEYFTALDNHADYFITRDLKDYRKSLSPILPVFTPVQFKDIIKDHTIFASSVVR